jgi:predicted transcriptional regulator
MNIFIKEFPDELHRDLKILAAKSGLTLKATMVKALEQFVKEQIEKERAGK